MGARCKALLPLLPQVAPPRSHTKHALVKAAAAIVDRAGRHHVQRLGVAAKVWRSEVRREVQRTCQYPAPVSVAANALARGDAGRVVVAVPHAALKVRGPRGVAAECERVPRGVDGQVRVRVRGARGAGVQVVGLGRLRGRRWAEECAQRREARARCVKWPRRHNTALCRKLHLGRRFGGLTEEEPAPGRRCAAQHTTRQHKTWSQWTHRRCRRGTAAPHLLLRCHSLAEPDIGRRCTRRKARA